MWWKYFVFVLYSRWVPEKSDRNIRVFIKLLRHLSQIVTWILRRIEGDIYIYIEGFIFTPISEDGAKHFRKLTCFNFLYNTDLRALQSWILTVSHTLDMKSCKVNLVQVFIPEDSRFWKNHLKDDCLTVSVEINFGLRKTQIL